MQRFDLSPGYFGHFVPFAIMMLAKIDRMVARHSAVPGPVGSGSISTSRSNQQSTVLRQKKPHSTAK